MLCPHCQQRLATVHITHVINGRREEHVLCEDCAPHIRSDFTGAAGFGLEDWMASPFTQRPIRRHTLMDGLSDDARRLIESAGAHASARGTSEIAPEHLLLAVLAGGGDDGPTAPAARCTRRSSTSGSRKGPGPCWPSRASTRRTARVPCAA